MTLVRVFNRLGIIILAICVVCAFSLVAEAKNLYVDAANGNDATSYASNDAGHPWRSIGRAAKGSANYNSPNASEAARAGDTVFVEAGTYWENGTTSGGRFTVTLNPINNGTAGNLITFRGVGNVYVRLNSSYRGAMIGCEGRNYIVWDHFIIDDTFGGSTSDTGPVVFSSNSNYCQLINSTVQGHNGSYYHGYPTYGGNYRLVGLEDAHHNLIRNNSISRALMGGSPGGQNEACIMLYDSNDNIFEHNEIFNCGAGIFVKGAHSPETQDRNIIRFNFLHTNLHGIRVLTGDDTKVYQNILANCRETGLYAGFGQAARSQWVNNTVYNCPRGIVLQGSDLIAVGVYNNIVVGSTQGAIYNWPSPNPSSVDATFNRNWYYGNSSHAVWESMGAISFSAWQGSYGKDPNASNGSNAGFVAASSNNFRLQAGSPAASFGRVVYGIGGNNGDPIPVGAYITGMETIGLLSASSDVTPPQAPDNVRIQ